MAETQATHDGDSTHEHGFDAIREGDNARFTIERGRLDRVFGTVMRVERFDAGDVNFAIVDTRKHGVVRFDWHGDVSRVADDRVIGRHKGDVLRIRPGA